MLQGDSWELCSPLGSGGIKQCECAPRLRQLEGARIGLIDDDFFHANLVMGRVQQRLSQRPEFSSVISYRRQRSLGALQVRNLIQEFVKDCDAAVIGVAG